MVVIHTRFVNIPLTRTGLELSYCRRLQDAVDVWMEVDNGNLQLQCWVVDKSYTSYHFMHGGPFWTRTLEFAVCKRTSFWYQMFVGLQLSELFTVLLRQRDCF